MSRAFLSLFALVAATLAGCGSSHVAGAPHTPQPARVQPVDLAPAVSRSTDQRVAKAGLLRLSDLPSGWATDDSASSNSSGADCGAIKDYKRTASALRTAPTMERNGWDQIQEKVAVFADGVRAEHAFAAVTSASTRACIRKFMAQTGTVGQSGQLNVDRVADGTAASRITVHVESGGTQVDLTVDLVVVRAGHAIALLVFTSAFGPFDQHLRSAVTRAAGCRLQHAQKLACGAYMG